jgi:hypothetical protein
MCSCYPCPGRRYQRIARFRQLDRHFHIHPFTQMTWRSVCTTACHAGASAAGRSMPGPQKQKPRRVSSPGFMIGTTGSGRQYRRRPRAVMRGAIYFLNC